MDPMQVAVRLRPLVPSEINSGCRPCIEKVKGQSQIVVGNNQPFSFNYVFDDSDGQIKIYESCVQPLISKLFEGYNVTILAYGQTGTGKTYTMGTNYSGSGSMGIIPRAILEIFEQIGQSSKKCEVSVSFLELYNEVLYDLLTLKDREQSVVELRETGNSLIIPGLTHKEVKSAENAMEFLYEGSSLRVTGATAMNATSSRSHAVFTVSLKITPTEEPKNSVQSKFHLVDLAGSERAKKTGASGERFKEGVNINRGLLVLGNVISQLGGNTASYINYRDSKLTRLLQDSLGGNSYTLMIACISPADSNQEESLCTLRYADRVKKIKNKPVINVDPQAALISQLKKEVEDLRLQIISPGTGGSCPPSHNMLEEKLMAEMKRNSELSSALKSSLHQKPALYERSLMIENVQEKTKEHLSELTDILKKAVVDPSTTTFEKLLEMVQSFQCDHVQAEKDIIDHSKREQEEEINHTSFDNNLEPPDDIKEEYVLFQFKTNREIEALTKNLILKQDLYDQLQKNNGELAHLNDSKHSIEYLTNLVKKLESEKQSLLMTKSKSLKNRLMSNGNDTGTPENIQQRLQQLENELQKAQKKLAEQEKLLKFKAKSDEKIVTLKREIQSMKAMKVQLIHQMRAENERFRNWQSEKNREVCKLRSINAKQTNQISRMEKEFTVRQAVLRRKLEAAAAAKKRIEQAVDRRNISSLKKAKNFEPEKLEEYITAEIDVHESICYAKKSLQSLLDDRSSLMKEIHSLQDMIDCRVNALSTEEIENCRKKKCILQQEAELQSTQIADLQQKIMNSRQDERKKQRWDGIKSIVEAKHALCFLFNSISKSKKDILNFNDITKDLKTELEDALKEISELQRQMNTSEIKNKKKCDDIVREYEEKIYEILSQRNENRNAQNEEEDDLPLQNCSQLSTSRKYQQLPVKRRTSIFRQSRNSYEAEYFKFLQTNCYVPGENVNRNDENTPPPEKKSCRENELNKTFERSPNSNKQDITFEKRNK